MENYTEVLFVKVHILHTTLHVTFLKHTTALVLQRTLFHRSIWRCTWATALWNAHSYREVIKEHMAKNSLVQISLDYSFHTHFHFPCYLESGILSFLFQPTQGFCGITWFQQASEVITANFLNSNEVVFKCHSNYANSWCAHTGCC